MGRGGNLLTVVQPAITLPFSQKGLKTLLTAGKSETGNSKVVQKQGTTWAKRLAPPTDGPPRPPLPGAAAAQDGAPSPALLSNKLAKAFRRKPAMLRQQAGDAEPAQSAGTLVPCGAADGAKDCL
jgi:hypothetical protein